MKKDKVLKVWGGAYHGFQFSDNNVRSKRMLIGAYTKKQAAELGEISSNHFRTYFCETGNANELATVTEVGVWIVNGLTDKILGRWK